MLSKGPNSDIIIIEDYTVIKRASIENKEARLLWVRSAGRCAICNKYLLDLDYDVTIGEMAHVVGWKKTEKSPRGMNDLAVEERNLADNLILLCADHHKIVDTKELLEEFTVGRLIRHKRDHEARIFHLTSLQADAESVVIRMMGGIRGAVVEVSKEHVRNVVFNSERKFATFPNSFDKHGIEIELTGLPEPGEYWESYWQMGKEIIDMSLISLRQGITKGSIRHLSVFALTRIPFLVYLGYQLDDKVPTSIYQKHRGDEETWMWSDEEKVESFEIISPLEKGSTGVVLILCISGTVEETSVPQDILQDRTVYFIRPVGTVPNRNIFRNKQSHENFIKTYHEFLSQLEVHHKGCEAIHLLGAIPLAAAISCGRGIMREAQPPITIYDLNGQEYRPTLTINAK